jgi:hypothetical protein
MVNLITPKEEPQERKRKSKRWKHAIYFSFDASFHKNICYHGFQRLHFQPKSPRLELQVTGPRKTSIT